MTESKQSALPPRRFLFPYFVLIVGLLITAFFSYYVWRTAEAKDSERFKTSTQELTTYVRGRPRLYIEVLRAATGLFAVSPSINPGQFQKFVERLELGDQYPGAQGIGFLVRVRRDQKDSFDATTKQRDLKDFHLWPDQDQNQYALALHFEALKKGDPAVGDFDLHTDPVCVTAMETARDTGLPATTAKVMLSQGTKGNKQAGFLIYAPIYENDRTPTTVAERREALSGFVYSRLRAADFLDSVLAIKHTSDIDLRLYDGLQASPENLLADTAYAAGNTNGATPPDFKPRFTATSTTLFPSCRW